MMEDIKKLFGGRVPVIYGVGRFQRDFEYIFQGINKANCYISDEEDRSSRGLALSGETVLDIKNVSKDFFYDKYVIICRPQKETATKHLENLGMTYKTDFIDADALFPLLDKTWKDERNGRILAFWGVGKECDYLEGHIDISCDVYIDRKKRGERKGKPVIGPDEIDDWGKYYIVVTSLKYYREIKAELQLHALTEYKDFVIYRKLLMEDFWLMDRKMSPLLAGNLQENRNGRILAFWGVGKECDYLEGHIDISCDVYIDRKKRGERKGKPVIGPDEIDDWGKYYIVITSVQYYVEIKAELQWHGLAEDKDFVISRKLLIENDWPMHMKPSDMLRETIYAKSIKAPACMRPFDYVELVRGNVFCCCPAWVNSSFGNMNKDSLDHIWNSYTARIFRLSIINRTFSFCKKQECALLKEVSFKEEKTRELDAYQRFSQKPTRVLVSIDPRCNLKCPQCRDAFYKLTDAEESLINLELDRIHESGWLESATLSVTGLGETFFSPVYRNLLYNTNVRRDTISIISNGLLFTEKETQKLISIYNNIYISLSVDAATKDTYTKIRGGNFDILIRNIKALVKHRKNNEIKSLGLSFVVQKLNYMEIPQFITLAHELEVDWILFQKFHLPNYMEEKESDNYAIADKNDVPTEKLIKVLRTVKDIDDPMIRWYQLSNYLKYVSS